MDTFNPDDLVVQRDDQAQTPWRVKRVQAGAAPPTVICVRPEGGPEAEFPEADLRLYKHDLPTLWRIRTRVSIGGLVLAFLSCALAALWPQWLILKVANSIFWTLAPPLWFIVEYCWLFPRWGNPRNDKDLQYGQGLASKFWLGIASLLVVIYSQPVPEWEITVQNSSGQSWSFFVALETNGKSTAQVEKLETQEPVSLLVGSKRAVIKSIKVRRDNQELRHDQRVRLLPGRRCRITVNRTGNLEVSVSRK